MANEISYSKMRILFINIFAILYKAAGLNMYRLYSDLRDVKQVVNTSKQELWIRQLFIFLISGLILMRFVMCFVGLASNIVAIYPLLTNSQAEMLMPTIIIQAIDNVVLNIYEIILGYGSVSYLQPQSMAVFLVMLTKMIIKISCSISALNIFSEYHHHLTNLAISNEDANSLDRDSSQEFEISNQNLLQSVH